MSTDIFVDGYGCRYQSRGVGLPYCVHSPLADAERVADVEAFAWPDPEAPGLIAEDAREQARILHDRGEFVTSAGLPPIYHQYHHLRGFERWMLDVRLLCFRGGIDVEHVLPFGPVKEVRRHVRQGIDILAPGGGYWFKAQVISPVIPP